MSGEKEYFQAKATCHPHLSHHAKGLCVNCYWRSRNDLARQMYRSLHHLINQEKDKTVNQSWYHKNRYKRKWWLKSTYGIDQSDFDNLVKQQKGKCKICSRSTPRLVVDHDHTTGKVRGLLCTRCNTSLGQLGDNVSGLSKAIQYLRKAA